MNAQINIQNAQNIVERTFGLSHKSVHISLKRLYNNMHLSLLIPFVTSSVSWFITDEYGNMHKNGVSNFKSSHIDVSNLDKGQYAIRIMGEVYYFELN